jgi:hypothetical protein
LPGAVNCRERPTARSGKVLRAVNLYEWPRAGVARGRSGQGQEWLRAGVAKGRSGYWREQLMVGAANGGSV